jgi:hypothetical protein
MTTAYTSLLGLALPVTGELSGTWGDTVNNSITSLLDSAIAGTTTLSTDADVTLTTTTGAANTSREAILLWTAGGTATRTITAPAQSKIYTVINASSSTQSIKLVGAGPTTGVTIIKGESALCAWNGSDFIKISNTAGSGVFSSITNTGLTSGRVVYSTTGGLETDSANLTFDGTNLSIGGSVSSTIASKTAQFNAAGGSIYASFADGTKTWRFGAGIQSAGVMSLYNATDAVNAFNVTATGQVQTNIDATVYGITVGRGAGAVSTNTAVGASALSANSTGSDVTAVGNRAYRYGTANNNTAFGSNALGNGIVTGAENTALGRASLFSNTSGASNLGVGPLALLSNTTGSYNIAIGQEALQANTTASYNTAVGYQAGYSNTTGNYNVALGYASLYSNTTADQNTAVGYESLRANTTGAYNSASGFRSLYSNTTGNSNVAQGFDALRSNTTASSNTAVGYQAGYSNTTGATNVALGQQAGYTNTTSSSNTFIGTQSGYLTTGGQNTFTGYQSGYYVTGSYNTAHGWNALSNITSGASGSYNTAVGGQALQANTTASSNTAVGYQAGYSTTTGQYNTVLGQGAGYTSTGGNYNTYVGREAGNLTTGSNNQFIGNGAGRSVTTGSGNSIIGNYSGNQGGLDIRTSSNNVVLSDGDGSIAARWASGGGWYQLNNSASWSTTSDARIKENVTSITNGLDVILALNPVEFDYKLSKQHTAGFIAQDYEKVLPDQIIEDANISEELKALTNGDPVKGIQQNLVPYLVSAIQSLKAEFDAYKVTHP